MQRGLIAGFFVDLVHHRHRLRPRNRNRLPRPKAHPQTLFLARILNVEKSQFCTVFLQHIFHTSVHSQRRRPSEINAAVLQLLPIEHRDGNETARLRLAQIARPLEHRNRTQRGLILVFLLVGLDLTGILRAGAHRNKKPCRQREDPRGKNANRQ